MLIVTKQTAITAFLNNACIFHLWTTGQANEMYIAWDSDHKITLSVQNKDLPVDLCCGYTLDQLVYGWHRHCFTYRQGGYFRVCSKTPLSVEFYFIFCCYQTWNAALNKPFFELKLSLNSRSKIAICNKISNLVVSSS